MNDSKIAATSRHLAGKRELKEEFAVADRDGDGRVSFEEFKVLLAVFEFFVRRLPDRRSFLLAAGLEQVLDYLEGLHFTDEDTMRADASPWMCSAAKMRLSKASRCCAKS